MLKSIVYIIIITVNIYLLRGDYMTGTISCWDYNNETYIQGHYAHVTVL